MIAPKTLQTLASKIKEMGFHSFIRDGMLYVSAEEGDDAADYYGEYRGGDPWINPKLEELACNNDAFWEWQNPGCIELCD